MAHLADSMPEIKINRDELKKWGTLWLGEQGDPDKKTGAIGTKKPNRFTKRQSVNFASFIDQAVAKALAEMLGKIPVVQSNGKSLRPAAEDVVEWGAVRVIGGIRPQNFDVAYRPDGPRVAFDSKTLNDKKSVGKNWQNMVNDLATESATVHTRYPYAVVGLMFVIPKPALGEKQEADIIRTLERLGSRADVIDQHHLAEAVGMVVWHPETGEVDPDIPAPTSTLRVEKFSERLYPHYVERYKGLPPHDEAKSEEEGTEPGDDADYVEDADE
jgi:hypothetical protein